MHDFVCLSISPIDLQHPGLAVATTRAGGVAVLDGEFCCDKNLDVASRNLQRFLARADHNAPVGLRLRTAQLRSSQPLLRPLCDRVHWLVVCGWESSELSSLQAALPPSASRTLLIEVTSASQIPALADAGISFHGIVARGHESGGWVGADSAFILTQKLLEAQPSPVYVQGGIGIHTAAACRAVGAAGVVLDDQLWLMPESPLPAEWRQILGSLNGQETQVIGERLGGGLRVLVRPGFEAATSLQQEAEQLELDNGTTVPRFQRWREKAQSSIGWGAPDTLAWPMGQSVGLAAHLREQYKTTGRLVQAILKESRQHIETARSYKPLQPDAPLAASHGTRYPIVQGPMTRVSDRAPFADSVAKAGALPLLALAMMKRAQVTPLLRETQEMVGERSWGVGILGFVPQELREQQIQSILEVKPPFALIAGGRPDQAAQLEAEGIATYIHAPVPSLLKMFLEQGARRFVFEGRECGGHVGPLSSFMLWESMIETLLSAVTPEAATDVHILFAGGIHDARSAAMISAMAAPLVECGMKIGVLMGTAYLFTEEAVSCGAIVDAFQEQALRCDQTINLETGPGHAIRCAATPFSDEFYATRLRMLKDETPPTEITKTLEALTLGRLRIASKGLTRNTAGELNGVGREQQLNAGMYMMGQVATMRSKVCSMLALHHDVSEASTKLLEEHTTITSDEGVIPPMHPSEIAIVGISTFLPKAQSPEVFWQNILHKVDAITEIPPDRWDWRLYYDSDRKQQDKVYSKWGGFLDDVPFDPIRFGIPPNSVKSINPSQLLGLEAVRLALEDAGYESGNFDREQTSVIFGSGDGGGSLGDQYVTRSLLPLFVESPTDQVFKRLPEWTEESFPGVLPNVGPGRVANRFDLGGSNFVIDAACASALTAVDVAIGELESGRSNVVITGGVDTAQSPYFYTAFSKTQALSPTGRSRAFDQAADGIVISEGIVIVILKRLADAERDGDRIYAVIRGAAGSSDGKAKGLTAPRSLGQRRALERAYRKAGVKPSTIGLYEAHGTGTAVGDQTELETVLAVLAADNAESESCAIGSVKTLVGHTKTAAGVVGVVKSALSLYHKVLPPHAGVENPLAPITEQKSPVFLLNEPRPWFAHPDHRRRCGVSAFGFGGTNSHLVMEEYTGALQPPAPGADSWPYELFVLRAADRAGLAKLLQSQLDAFGAGAVPRLRSLAYSYAQRAQEQCKQPVCLCIVSENLAHLKESLELSLAHLQEHTSKPLPSHILLNPECTQVNAPLAFVFPGQGAQYPNMAQEVALYFDEMRTAAELADKQLQGRFPKLLSQYIYPPGAFSEADERLNHEPLKATHFAQPAIGVVSIGLMDVLGRLGLKPAMVCGHSYGEYTALHAAGVLSRTDFLSLSATRGKLMGAASGVNGAMAAVWMSREDLTNRLHGQSEVVIANHNTPRQSVISGDTHALKKVVESLSADGIRTTLLPVGSAFHSPLMTSAKVPLSKALETIEFHRPQVPVYANATARPYPSGGAAICSQLSNHLLSSVEFVRQIHQMYEDGARVFVEPGPKNILTGLIDEILEGRVHTAVSFDAKGGGMRGFLIAIATLMTCGVDVNLTALFERRDVRPLNLSRLVELTQKAELSPTTWLVNGGNVRPKTEKVGYAGELPPLTQETRQASPQRETHQTAQPALTPTGQPPTMPSQTNTNTAGSQKGTGNAGFRAGQPDPDALAAYQAYQETMRQFLTLQEESIQLFLGGQQSVQAGVLAQSHRATSEPLPEDGQRAADVPLLARSPAEEKLAQIEEEPQASNLPFEGTEKSHEALESSIVTKNLTDRETLTQMLVDLVSDRTGYPPDMLGLDLDIEADLGIDSIKRVEILDSLQKNLPDALVSGMQEQIESLTRVKSLNGLIDAVLPNEPDAGPTSEPSPAEALPYEIPAEGDGAKEKTGPTPAEVPTTDGLVENTANPGGNGNRSPASQEVPCPRYIIQPQAEPTPETKPIAPEGLFLITEDSLSIAHPVSETLKQRGASTAIISRSTLSSPEELERMVAELRHRPSPVRGIVHLSALAATEMPETLAEWRTYTQIESKSLFQLVRFCEPDLRFAGQSQFAVLSASLLGGYFGRDVHCGPGLPTGGSSHGLLKTLEAEYPGVLTKAIDFDPTRSPEGMAEHIVAELLMPSGDVEVGYPKGERTIFHVVPKPLTGISYPTETSPNADWVVLTTGGRGITAEVAQSFAQPGMRMIVVGRSPEPEAESPDTAGVEEIASLRQILLSGAKTDGESPTPAQIETQLQKLRRNRAILHNLEKLRRAGVRVEYRAVDVRDEEQFGSLIDDIYSREGRLDAVIHGAGIIEDGLIAHKSLSSFDQVFDTKADSTFILSRRLRPDSLKLFVLFSSVAARLGNRGQADYAAANEVMNRFAWRLNLSWPSTHVVAINWGPWDTIGMASVEVNRRFRERGIIPIPPSAGTRFFAEEIGNGNSGESEVIAGKGPWFANHQKGVDPVSEIGLLISQINAFAESDWLMAANL